MSARPPLDSDADPLATILSVLASTRREGAQTLQAELIRRFGDAHPRLAATLADYAGDPGTYEKPLLKILREIGVDRDPELVTLADRLSRQEQPRVGVDRYGVRELRTDGGPAVIIGGDQFGRITMGPTYELAGGGDPRLLKQRRDLLTRVRRQFIHGDTGGAQRGLLEQIAGGADLLEVVMVHDPESVSGDEPVTPPEGRLGQLVHTQTVAASPPAEESARSIAEAFDACAGELLILGVPGAGKTTQLFVLLAKLLDDALADDAAPIPIVLSLAGWGVRRAPMEEWLYSELTARGSYELPPYTARLWLDEDRLLPLLDGLDELPAGARADCVGELNGFQGRRRQAQRGRDRPAMVVTSRTDEYMRLQPTRLHLRGAVRLQPLKTGQVEAYLARGGASLTALRQALQTDNDLQSMAEQPLFLKIMAEAYRDSGTASLAHDDDHQGIYASLFAVFVDRMFARNADDPRYPRERTLHWLGWLGGTLARKAQTVFYIDRIQPDWLYESRHQRMYAVLDRLGWGLVIGVLSALPGGLIGWADTGGNSEDAIAWAVGMGVCVGTGAGLLGGRDDSPPRLWHSLRNTLTSALVGAVLGGAVFTTLLDGMASDWRNALGLWRELRDFSPSAVVFVLVYAVMFALILGFVGGVTAGPGVGPRQIATAESMHRSTNRTVLASVLGLLVGLFIWFYFWSLERIRLNDVVSTAFNGATRGAIYGIVGAAALGYLFGLEGGETTAKSVTSPNQGIRRWLTRGIASGLVAGVVLGVMAGVGYASSMPPELRSRGALYGLAVGLLIALGGALISGGYPLLSHLTLRFVLARSGAQPADMVGFLEYCTQLLFLRRIGGGYIFVHRLLQDYFAEDGVHPPRS